MSTFPGIFDELPYISTDRFDGVNLRSQVFFLSHCHADHMVGLNNPNGLPGPLYTSAISQVLVRKQFPNVKDIRVLEIEGPEQISFEVDGKDYRIVVTTLPARHCPGSVMFLFQSPNYKVLYTGDFRLTKLDLESQFSTLGQFEPDVMYLDSTFLNKCYMHFPTQVDSIKIICTLISEWITKSPQHKINVRIPAQYGSEFLFIEIARKLKHKIYVASGQLEKYIYFPDMDHCISSNRDQCQIYSQQPRENFKFEAPPYQLLRTIQPSAIYWRNWQPNQPIHKETKPNVFRVAYSSHSSYAELKDFVEFVKPKEVKLSVVSVGGGNDMRQHVDEILSGIMTEKKLTKDFKPIVTKCNFDNLLRVKSDERNEIPKMPLKTPMKRMKL